MLGDLDLSLLDLNTYIQTNVRIVILPYTYGRESERTENCLTGIFFTFYSFQEDDFIFVPTRSSLHTRTHAHVLF